MNLVLACILFALIVVGLYVAGWFSTPYLNAFRFAFYFLLILLVITVAFEFMGHQYEGYDPTARVP